MRIGRYAPVRATELSELPSNEESLDNKIGKMSSGAVSINTIPPTQESASGF